MQLFLWSLCGCVFDGAPSYRFVPPMLVRVTWGLTKRPHWPAGNRPKPCDHTIDDARELHKSQLSAYIGCRAKHHQTIGGPEEHHLPTTSTRDDRIHGGSFQMWFIGYRNGLRWEGAASWVRRSQPTHQRQCAMCAMQCRLPISGWRVPRGRQAPRTHQPRRIHWCNVHCETRRKMETLWRTYKAHAILKKLAGFMELHTADRIIHLEINQTELKPPPHHPLRRQPYVFFYLCVLSTLEIATSSVRDELHAFQSNARALVKTWRMRTTERMCVFLNCKTM